MKDRILNTLTLTSAGAEKKRMVVFCITAKSRYFLTTRNERLEHTVVEYLTFMLINVNALIIWITHYNILKDKCITDKEYIDTDSAPQKRPLKV